MWCCRHLEPGCDPVHAGVWWSSIPGSQWQWDIDNDHGLSLHCTRSRVIQLSRVCNLLSFVTVVCINYVAIFTQYYVYLLLFVCCYYYFFDPGTQFAWKQNYAMQRQNTQTSWNGFYFSSSFTKLSSNTVEHIKCTDSSWNIMNDSNKDSVYYRSFHRQSWPFTSII